MIADRSRPRLLILGCSTRAAAWSAVRAGFFPVCADQFGDADLRQVAEVLPLSRYPQSAPNEIRGATAAAWMYVGGMENHANTLRDILKFQMYLGPLLGCAPDRLASIRSPMNLQSAAGRVGLKPLAVHGATEVELRDSLESRHILCTMLARLKMQNSTRKWIVKDRNGSGGQRVRMWDSNRKSQTAWIERHLDSIYFQEYAEGLDLSAVFIADGNGVKLVGITRQLIGEAVASTPEPFGYCGTIGPVSILPPHLDSMARAVAFLRELTKLRGVIGVDFKLHENQISLLEINPRYTASCEILELALRRPLLTEHWRACLPDGDPPPAPLPVTPRCGAAPPVLGKMIVYAREAVTASDFSRFLQPRSPWTVPFLADIPNVGTRFEPGQPVCTVFASGTDDHACYAKLVRRVRRVRKWLNELSR